MCRLLLARYTQTDDDVALMSGSLYTEKPNRNYDETIFAAIFVISIIKAALGIVSGILVQVGIYEVD